ncbi:MAG TPA: TlpA family protein disulfide reductase [Flavobacteriia bacterium]|nr:TlpA family protein disulfide reductase [Flavobacteriia bacterium]
MKKILFMLTLLSVFTTNIVAQDYSFIDKKLHIMDDAELQTYKVQFTADTPVFDAKGNTIKPGQINDLLKSGNFVPVIFGDDNHQAQAIVFRDATPKEKEEFEKWQAQQNPNTGFKPGEAAPDFEATDIEGNTYKLADLKGKIVVLNFWFTTCPPCIMEIPELNKIASKYKKNGVLFLAVTFDNKEKVTNFLKEHPFYFKIITDAKLVKKYGIIGFPTSILIDKEGKVMFKKIGIFTQALEESIKMYIEK